MRYTFKMKDGERWLSGWVETSDERVATASPYWRRFEGHQIYYVLQELQLLGFTIHVLQHKDAERVLFKP